MAAGDHLGDGLITDVREQATTEVRERDIRAVAKAEHLEVQVADLADVLQQPVVRRHQLVHGAALLPGLDVREGLDVGQRCELQRFQALPRRLRLGHPLLVHLRPVAEVVAGPRTEELSAAHDVIWVGDDVR